MAINGHMGLKNMSSVPKFYLGTNRTVLDQILRLLYHKKEMEAGTTVNQPKDIFFLPQVIIL